MGQKKRSKVILIVIIVLVMLMLLTSIAYVLLGTDLLKSNKELFFQYVTQIGEKDNGFIDKQLTQYFEKQKNTPYQNNGKITVDTNAGNVNGLNLTFDGEVNTANSQCMQNFSLNYSDTVNFPFTYKKIGDTIGIQTKYIGSKYVATKENENLLEDETSNLRKIEEFSKVLFTDEDKEYLKNTYGNILKQELQDNDFSKIEETNSKGYKLTLNGKKLKNLILKYLETLKNDQKTLDKINEYLKIQKNSLKITASDIDNDIREISNDSDLENENLEITVYQTKGKTNRLTLKAGEIEVKLEKAQAENNLQYNLELQINSDNQTGKIAFIAKFEGLSSIQSVTEDYQLTLELENKKYEYNYNNKVQFTDSVNIEEFNEGNALMLNELEEEQQTEFINAVMERIQAVNKSHMEELGVGEDENPLQYIIPQFDNYMNINQIDEVEVSTFNQKFENYESTNLQGVTVKGLLTTIQLNNESQEDENRKIKEIHFDGEEYEVTDQNIILLKSTVETETAYRVEFERDEETGIIYRAVINKK